MPIPAAANQPSESQSQNELQPDGEDGSGVRVEEGPDDEGEDRQHDPDQEGNDDQEEGSHAGVDDVARNFADGGATLANADHQCREVMDGTHEKGTHGDPHQGREPTPDDRDCRSDDGRGPGDGGVVVPPENPQRGRDEIHAVFAFARRHRFIGGEAKDAAR